MSSNNLERRIFSRYEIFLYGTVRRLPSEIERLESNKEGPPVPIDPALLEPQQAIAIDVSVTGMQFRSRLEMKLGEKVELNLPRANAEPILLLATVRFKRQISLASDVIAYGVEFEQESPTFKKEISDFIMAARAEFRKHGKRA